MFASLCCGRVITSRTAVTNTPRVPGMHCGREAAEEGADGRLRRSAEGKGASLAAEEEEEEEGSSSTTHQLIVFSRSGKPPARAPFSLRRHVLPALLFQPPGFPAVCGARGGLLSVCGARASIRVDFSVLGSPLSLPQVGLLQQEVSVWCGAQRGEWVWRQGGRKREKGLRVPEYPYQTTSSHLTVFLVWLESLCSRFWHIVQWGDDLQFIL